MNILSNAEQAIQQSGVIQIETKKEGHSACIIIKDSGIGIEEGSMSKILDPFYTTKPPGQGTGLGLSISKKIIEDHNGALNIKSNPDRGTEVYIVFFSSESADRSREHTPVDKSSVG